MREREDEDKYKKHACPAILLFKERDQMMLYPKMVSSINGDKHDLSRKTFEE